MDLYYDLIGKGALICKIASRKDACFPQDHQYMLRGRIVRGSLTPGDIFEVRGRGFDYFRTSLVEKVQIYDDKLIVSPIWVKANFYKNVPELIENDIILFTMNSIYLLRLDEEVIRDEELSVEEQREQKKQARLNS